MKHYYTKTLCLLSAILISTFGFGQTYSDGIFILNEGSIGSNNASISYLNTSGDLENEIFATQNSGMPLGDTGQGMGFEGDNAYVVLNNSNEIKVINASNFAFVASISDQIVYPRDIAFSNGNAYVTNWGDPGVTTDDYVAVVDLATNTVTSTISVVEGPEKIIEKNGKLFVAHKGGYGFGNSVSVIDTATNAVENISVGDIPSAIEVDANYLYVLCSGNPYYAASETSGKLYKIDLSDYQNTSVFTFPGLEHPQFLGLDDASLYYVLDANIYKMALTATELPTTAFVETTSENILIPYGFNTIDGKLYLADAVDYVTNGKVYVYDNSGSLVNNYTTGLLPSAFYQNESTLDVNSYDFSNLSIYPNPANDSFNLNLSEQANLKIYDISGRLVKQTTRNNNEAISLNGLKSGLYLVSIEVNGKISTQKLIKQ